MKEPKFQDIVRNNVTNVTGTVIGKYPLTKTIPCTLKPENWFVDVRLSDDRIWWESPIENWDVLVEYKG